MSSDSIFKNVDRSAINDDGNSGTFALRLDSPLTAITAIAVAICLLIITIFSIIFAVLQVSSRILLSMFCQICLHYIFCSFVQRNSNHVSRNSVRYRKIISRSDGRMNDPNNEARFIFNVGEDGDDTDDNTDDDLDVTTRTIKKVAYEPNGPMNGNEFFIKSTNDIDAVEFHCKRADNVNQSKLDTQHNVNIYTENSSPTYLNQATSSIMNNKVVHS